MQRIKKYTLAVLVMVAFATYCTAQATDTIQLSVFNTGAKYRLTPATFGAPTTGAELLTEMVFVHDTIMSYVATGNNATTFLPPTLVAKMSDSLRRVFQSQKLMRPVITYRCDKPIREDVKDKVVIMQLGTCDPSIMCMNAQNAGAKVVILIHTSNKADSIVLKKGPGRDSLKIRCYSVTQDMGNRITALMPSHIAIKKRVVTPNQNLVAQPNDGVATTEAKDAAKSAENDADTEESSEKANSLQPSTNSSLSTKVKFGISPNPSHDQTTLTYQFTKATDATITVETASGQVVLSQNLKGVTVGSLDISTSEWANGTYILSLQSGKDIKTKKFVVQH
jgi:hypothetical protein